MDDHRLRTITADLRCLTDGVERLLDENERLRQPRVYTIGLHSLIALATGDEVAASGVVLIAASDFPRDLFLSK